MTTLAEVRAVQPEWFSAGNKRFFGDVSYKVLHGKITHKPYLIRYTSAWTDMFDQPKSYHYRVNPLADNLEILSMTDDVFKTIDDVKEWLESN